jgi:hypothetical protein
MTDDGLLVEGMRVQIVEDGAGRDQGVGDGLAGGLTDPQLDAGWIDALLLRQVLARVERTFGSSVGFLRRCRVAYDDQPGVCLLVQSEGDVIQAALGFVVDAYGATLIASKAETAELLGLWKDRDRRSCDDDVGGGLGALAEIIDNVAGYGNGAGAKARGNQPGCRSSAGNGSSGRGVGVGQRTILRAGPYGADLDVGAGDGGAGVRTAGQGRRLKCLDGEGGGAGGLLTSLRAFFDVTGDGVVSGSEVCRIDGRFGTGGHHFAAV